MKNYLNANSEQQVLESNKSVSVNSLNYLCTFSSAFIAENVKYISNIKIIMVIAKPHTSSFIGVL